MVLFQKGNLLTANDVDIICHQVNTIGVMGAGIAKSIASTYPECFKEYKHFLEITPSSSILGKVCFYEGEKVIANIFGQKSIGRGLRTNYEALNSGLVCVHEYAKNHRMSVGIPFKIGCGLAGGDWNVVSKMIENIFGNSEVVCRIYTLS